MSTLPFHVDIYILMLFLLSPYVDFFFLNQSYKVSVIWTFVCLIWDRVLGSPRLVLNLLCSHGCPWTPDTSSSVIRMLGLQVLCLSHLFMWCGNWLQDFMLATKAPYPLSSIPSRALVFWSPLFYNHFHNYLISSGSLLPLCSVYDCLNTWAPDP